MALPRAFQNWFVAASLAMMFGIAVVSGIALWPTLRQYFAVQRLEKSLENPDSPEVVAAVENVERAGAVDWAVEMLVERLSASDAATRAAAITVFAELARKSPTAAAVAAPVIAKGIEDDTVPLGWAASALAAIGPRAEVGVRALIQLLQRKDQLLMTTQCAATALGEIGPAAIDAIPALVERLADDDPQIRFPAVEALRKIGNSGLAIPSLIKMIENPQEYDSARLSAINLLRELDSEAKAGVPVLAQTLLEDQNPIVRDEAASALRTIDPDALVSSLLQAIDHKDAAIRLFAVVELAEFRSIPENTVAALRRALQDSDDAVRSAAKDALRRRSPDDALAFPRP